jgi:MFS family permease
VRLGRLEYKWVALTNTTLGMLMATINASILLIALPDIFRGIHIDPLAPGNTSYLLWLILSFLVVMAVLLVSLGRLGDIYGRVRMFNLGFAVFTVFSILLSITWMHGSAGALWLILMRVGQGVGGALIFANSSAIFAIAACLVAAFASLLRGGKYVHEEATSPPGAPTGLEPVEPDAPEIPRRPAHRPVEETG